MPLQISEKVMALAAQAQAGLRDQFDRIDSIAEENTRKVLAAFQKHRVAEAYFAGTTGYGYDDLGRDKLDEIFAELFGTEDALVRVQFVNGTHAISCALFGALKPGDILVSAVGAPYDTMLGVIGVVDKGPGSLKSYGIEYRQVDLLDDAPDPEGLARAVRDPRVKAVLIQRSKGYSTRSSLSVAEIGALCQVVRANNPEAAMRLTTPGIGKECGSTFGANRSLYQGLFLAPHTTAQAVKTAVFAARMMELLGYRTEPTSDTVRHDIIQMIHFGAPEPLKKFCKGIQFGAPVDSFVTPEPWDMPGYDCPVIMAAGAFIQGASIELSCDAPMREPYTAYLQGGLTYESGKAGVLLAVEELLRGE